METILTKEILDIYKICGLSGQENTMIRNSINLGTLDRRLKAVFSNNGAPAVVRSNIIEPMETEKNKIP